MAKKLTFAALDAKLSKISPRGSILSKNSFSRVDEWINTGNYMLNAHISGSIFGGFPNSRSVMVSGDPGTGKTFIALNACREAQKLGYSIIYCDTEAAVDEPTMKKFGIDTDNVRYQPIGTVSEMRHIAANIIVSVKEVIESGGEVPKIMVVLDSLGNMATSKERTDAVTAHGAKDMTKQGELRSMFRVLTTDFAEFKIPLIICNHTYDGFSMYGGKEVSGGGGAKFNASISLMLSKSMLKDEKNKEAKDAEMKQVGIIVRSTIQKNRFARPIPVRFHISFFGGMNKYTGLEKYINWESCGIERGKVLTEAEVDKEFPKWTSAQKISMDVVDIKDYKERYGWEHDGEKMYFFRMPTARSIAVKHLNKQIKPVELFTPETMTDDVLKSLDEMVIKPLFMLPDISSLDDLIGVAEKDVEEVEEEVEEEEND